MAVLPSQKIKARKYRSKIDPIYSDATLIFGIALLLFGAATDHSEIGYFGAIVAGLAAFSVIIFFCFGLFRAQFELPVYVVTLLVSVSGILITLYVGFHEPIDLLLHQSSILCGLIFSESKCLEHGLALKTQPLKTVSDYLLLAVLHLYFIFATFGNFKTHQLAKMHKS